MGFFSRTHSTQKINLTWEVYLHSVCLCPSDLVMANSRLHAALGQPICPPLLTQHTSLCKDYLFVCFPVLAKQPCQKSQATGWHVLSGRMLLYLYHCFTFPTSIPKHSGELILHAHFKGLFSFIFHRCLFGERGKALALIRLLLFGLQLIQP